MNRSQEYLTVHLLKLLTMRAVKFYGQHDVRYEEAEIPVCGPGQVKVRCFRLFTFGRRNTKDSVLDSSSLCRDLWYR